MKWQKIYELLFDKAINLSNGIGYALNPKFVLISVTNQYLIKLKLFFPSTTKKGWFFFHLCKSVYRKVQSNGLVKKYETDEKFNLLIRQCTQLFYNPLRLQITLTI